MKRCSYCGQSLEDGANYCPRCGREMIGNEPPRYAPGYDYGFAQPSRQEWYSRNNPFDSDPVSGKSRGVMALLALFLGTLGIQYFYIGKTGAGLLTILLSIVSCGFWSIIVLIQGILLLLMSNQEFQRKFIDTTSAFPLF